MAQNFGIHIEKLQLKKRLPDKEIDGSFQSLKIVVKATPSDWKVDPFAVNVEIQKFWYDGYTLMIYESMSTEQPFLR